MDMEEVIKSIASIDKKAADIIKETEEYLAAKEKDIRGKIESMRLEAMNKAKLEANELYETSVKEAEAEAEKIRNKAKEDCNALTNRFRSIKGKLESQLFSRIFS